MHQEKETPGEAPVPPRYSGREELVNAITHGVGTGLSVAGLTLLVVLATLRGDLSRVVSFSIYGTSLTILYLASTLYHSLQSPPVKRVFRVIDHASIYVLIAGTYTPFLVVCAPGVWRWILLSIVWALALAGIGFKACFTGRYGRISTLAYAAMGWLGVFGLRQLLATVPLGGLLLLGAGGVVYTVGILFYAWKRLPYNHAIWHLFVMGGSICHYFAVLLYLVPAQ
jgi:hemolysin III